MPRRQDRFGYGVTIPATTARVVDTAVEILGDPDPDEMAFLHSSLRTKAALQAASSPHTLAASSRLSVAQRRRHKTPTDGGL